MDWRKRFGALAALGTDPMAKSGSRAQRETPAGQSPGNAGRTSRRAVLKTVLGAAATAMVAPGLGHRALADGVGGGHIGVKTPKSTDVHVQSVTLYFLPIKTRVPLKFGHQVMTEVTCARVKVAVRDRAGRVAEGWGETPLSVPWGWPSALPYRDREDSMRGLCTRLAAAWPRFDAWGHPVELGHEFLEHVLPKLAGENDRATALAERMPKLASLICASLFDIAIHDAYGVLLQRPTYATYGREFLNRDLSHYLEPAEGSGVSFAGRFPCDFLVASTPKRLVAWHLVGGLDALDAADLKPPALNDGYPVTLTDWIARDGLKCVKVKLRGNDAAWDYDRMVRVGALADRLDVAWLSADFNSTVTDPVYVSTIMDRLLADQPRTYAKLLYVEQPFPYELEAHPIDVHGVSGRKPLFLDESAHDWKMIRLGRKLGWSGVALKTCKTQTGAMLSLSWAKAHGMPLMVQDLSNPMMAQISHVQLGVHAGTIMGVETNGCQFYPAASGPEASVHPGLYCRRDGRLDLSTLGPTGFGYRVAEIPRQLPAPAAQVGG